MDKIEQLGLPKRAHNALINAGFVYIADLKGKRKALEKCVGLGEKSFMALLDRVTAWENKKGEKVF